MAKNNPPVMGYRACDVLDYFSVNPEKVSGDLILFTEEDRKKQHPHRRTDRLYKDGYEEAVKKLEVWIDYLRQRINHGLCLSDSQKKALMHDLRCLVTGEKDKLLPKKNILKILTELNSYRLKCRDCLNRSCGFRDPDHPVEEVEVRAKQFNQIGWVKGVDLGGISTAG